MSPWYPILTEGLATRALDIVHGIGRALGESGDRSFSLADGDAGQALLLAYFHEATPGRGYDEKAFELLARAVEGVSAEEGLSASLFHGFAGVAWVMEHLQKSASPGEEDAGEDVAEALAAHLNQSPWRRALDLMDGLAGFGVYALERSPRPGGKTCLERVVARLAETAEHRPDGIIWPSPSGGIDFGVSHGVPGIIGFLGSACALEVAEPSARPLLDGAVSWLLAHKLPAGATSVFPYFLLEGEEPEATHLAWCYGDLGVATTLLAVSRCVGETAWEHEAVAIGRRAAARSAKAFALSDLGLCHGAAGIAHLFNRLFQTSGEPVFREAALAWFKRVLDTEPPLVSGFLTGAAGMGLALLAAATPIEPAWDRVLLASCHPSPTP
ncbi:MAG TPA: lanthionine synthetase C family protein [Thermoanaerobaculia bacterium]|jgi:lantibiotic modifying enzyme|nr:lanthionine synthetase C family protein [Thermoanaerobaculia bacterium]